jgi:polysaccharide biosynthesis transport protein
MSTSLSAEDFDPKKYLRTLRRRWLVALLTALTTIGLAALAASTRKPSYEASGELLIESDRKSSLTGVGGKIGTLESLKREATPLDTQALVLKSTPLRAMVIEDLNLRDAKGKPLDPTNLPITVEVVVGSDVLLVKFNDPDRDRAAAVINRLMDFYIAQNRKLNNAEAAVAKGFIEQELPPAQAELERTARALQQYRTDHQIVALEKESNATVELLQKLTDQIQQTQAQIADTSAQHQILQSHIAEAPGQSVQAASLSQTPAIQTALTELRQIQSKLTLERARYQPTHPNVQVLQQQANDLEATLNQRIREVTLEHNRSVTPGDLQVSPLSQKLITDAVQLQVRQEGLEQQLAALEQMKTGFDDRRHDIPSFVKNEEDLKQQLDLAQKNYNSLRSKLAEIRLAEIQSVANARIIQPATPPLQPSNQARNLLLLAGTGAGLCLGIAAAFGADLIDRHLKTTDEIRAAYPYSLVGLIPRLNSAPKLWDSGGQVPPVPFIQEAFRMLQTHLKFLNPDGQSQTIVISSALPQEGKSTIAANLATTMAQSGQRVLLLDANFRSPIQHELWAVANGPGLSDWMLDADAMASIVQPVMPNLDLMTAGGVSPDATTWLESATFQQHLKDRRTDYDYILIDAPPLLDSVDAVILGKIADGLLLVARLGRLDDRSARAVQELLHRSGCPILGLVVNHLNLQRSRSSPLPPTTANQTPKPSAHQSV